MKRAVVVGSGAGGAMAARELAGTFDVIVLEAGSEFVPFGRDLGTIARLRSTGLFFDPRLIRVLFPAMRVCRASEGMPIVYGLTTGGTTTLATANAVRCDEALQARGIDLGEQFEALQSELPVSTAHEARWRPVTKSLYSACADLGLSPAVTPKLVDYSRCVRCGRCVLGCPRGAKWDSRRHLSQAVERGAHLQTTSEVERLVFADTGNGPAGRATGVVVRHAGRRRLVPADLVVLAAGGLGTGAILERSGIPVEPKLFVDPVLCVAAEAPGCHADTDVPMPFIVKGDGYIVSPYFDYFSFFFAREWRRPAGDVVSLMVKLADTEAGTVSARRRVTKGLTTDDRRRLDAATEMCTEILARVGARRDSVFLGSLNAGHPGGTLPLTGEERDELHPDRLPENVYAADASLLPESLGRPPSLTIMALALRVAGICRQRFG